MLKRTFSFLFSLALVATLCGTSFAVEERASTTLNSYSVTCDAGNKPGELQITYDVQAKRTADSLGVSSIKLYSSGGVYMTTILGNDANGLTKSDSIICKGTYSHTAVPGNSYYVAVTVFAEIGDDYDSRKIVTDTVTAPVVP